MNTVNKSPIPGSRGYTVDLDTHMVYNPAGKLMKPHIDNRKRVCTKIIRPDGKQQTIVIKDVVRNIRRLESNPLEKQQLELEKDLKIEFLIRQISTYHNILLHLDELKTKWDFEEKQQYLIDLGLGLDMDLATTVLQLVKTENGWLEK